MYDTQSLGAYYDTYYALAGILGIVWIGALVLCALIIVCNIVMFRKAYYAGWEAVVPVYNLICMCRIAGVSPWLLLLSFIPVVNVIFMLYLQIKYTNAYGVGVGMFIVYLVFPLIGLPIIAFSKKYEYRGC